MGSSKWYSEERWDRMHARIRLVGEGRAKQPFRVVKGVILPISPLTVRPLEGLDGGPPKGSSGWAHLLHVENGTAVVTDSATIGRFWSAVWEIRRQVWIATGDGEQFEDGQVVEVFSLEGS